MLFSSYHRCILQQQICIHITSLTEQEFNFYSSLYRTGLRNANNKEFKIGSILFLLGNNLVSAWVLENMKEYSCLSELFWYLCLSLHSEAHSWTVGEISFENKRQPFKCVQICSGWTFPCASVMTWKGCLVFKFVLGTTMWFFISVF